VKRILLACVAMLAINGMAHAEGPPLSFIDMIKDTGCVSNYSDEKKANFFASAYRGRTISIIAEIRVIKDGKLYLKGPSGHSASLTFDAEIALADKNAAYNLEKHQIAIVEFTVTTHGGCFLPYSGENGVVKDAA
jgi:hypothetical protein